MSKIARVTNSSKKVRRGDKVIVICGSYKGTVGNVLTVKDERAQVEGVNIMVRHRKGKGEERGRIDQIYGAIHVSNLSHVDSANKPVRVAFSMRDGKKYLINKKTAEEIRKV